jgi:hypothetical protein
MSHRILKPSAPEPRGLLTDISDMAESYWYWAKEQMTESWVKPKKSPNKWSISEFRTDNVKVYHANEEEV